MGERIGETRPNEKGLAKRDSSDRQGFQKLLKDSKEKKSNFRVKKKTGTGETGRGWPLLRSKQ